MKEKTIQLYTFAELLEMGNTRAIEKAREFLRECNTGHEWWDLLYYEWQQALDAIGFENAEIAFTGFWSQGDGASFTADVDMEKMLRFFTDDIEATEGIVEDGPNGFRRWIVGKVGQVYDARYKKILEKLDDIDLWAKVRRKSSHYIHENTCEVDAEYRGTFASIVFDNILVNDLEFDTLVNEFLVDVETLRKNLCRHIYAALEECYTYLVSDEALKETAEANDYHFRENGKVESVD